MALTNAQQIHDRSGSLKVIAELPPETLVAVEAWCGRLYSNITPWSFALEPSNSQTDLLDYDLREKVIGTAVPYGGRRSTLNACLKTGSCKWSSQNCRKAAQIVEAPQGPNRALKRINAGGGVRGESRKPASTTNPPDPPTESIKPEGRHRPDALQAHGLP